MEITNKILKSELVEWKKLKFIQSKDFKELPDQAYQKLKASLLKNNFVESFKVWQSNGDLFCLDGFHRCKVLRDLEAEGYIIPKKFNADFLDCKDEQEASKLVLIYSSIYANITSEGFLNFLNKKKIDFDSIKTEIDFPSMDIDWFKDAFIDPPDFSPGDESEQGRLDKRSKIKCPHCGNDFVPR